MCNSLAEIEPLRESVQDLETKLKERFENQEVVEEELGHAIAVALEVVQDVSVMDKSLQRQMKLEKDEDLRSIIEAFPSDENAKGAHPEPLPGVLISILLEETYWPAVGKYFLDLSEDGT